MFMPEGYVLGWLTTAIKQGGCVDAPREAHAPLDPDCTTWFFAPSGRVADIRVTEARTAALFLFLDPLPEPDLPLPSPIGDEIRVPICQVPVLGQPVLFTYQPASIHR